MAYNLKKARAAKVREERESSIEKRLRDGYDNYIAANKSKEGLLEEQRTGKSQTVTTEEQLESMRNGGNEDLTEKRMEDEKAPYGGVNRSSVASGNIPPLEAKRLESKPVMEKEKYKPANDK